MSVDVLKRLRKSLTNIINKSRINLLNISLFNYSYNIYANKYFKFKII